MKRIDELGRVVIPKELRKSLKIDNGNTLELILNDDHIILRKAEIVDRLNGLSTYIINAINEVTKKSVIIYDNCKVVASSNSKLIGLENSDFINNLVNKRNGDIVINSDIEVAKGNKIAKQYTYFPIISYGDNIGLILILDDEISDKDLYLCKVFAKLISNYID
ncbi:MAG: AbrB/MazE/SpoVT family DNA-binding domain-containing protein [Bacilli bacterium]|nr:AbrB/MazE/SpoVT family DNA-binding domain-containing protein [Bacilli bacterium]